MKSFLLNFSIVLFFLIFLSCTSDEKPEYIFHDTKSPVEVRVDDLISQLTLEEKVAQLVYDAPAINRLNIPAYNWWNECLHGVARNGLATVFPQAIGMAATFDTSQMRMMGDVIADEARAKYNKAISRNEHGIYQGLTFWTPNINIFRDPRWGRGMETYGEDPYLTGSLAIPFIKALQGNHPTYFKTIATSKHFVVHSGPEPIRHEFDAVVNQRDFLETYTPHFKRTIQEANVQSVMCAYNRLDGEACCGSNKLLNDLLRNKWGFQGYVVSDCWALMDFYKGHNISKSLPEAAALGLSSGTDLNCGIVFKNLKEAIQLNLISENDIDTAIKRLFTARIKLGMFDPDEMVPFNQISYDIVDCDKHKKIAHDAALKSMVLLQNKNQTLPLQKNLKKIAVIGPNANNVEVLLGNYNGYPSSPVTPLEGIINKVGENTEILYSRGCNHADGLPYFTTIPASVFYQDSAQSKTGLKVRYYNDIQQTAPAFKEDVFSNVNINWWDEAPLPEMKFDSFSVKWNGYIVPEISGDYILGGLGQTKYEIIFNKNDTLRGNDIHSDGRSQKQFYLEAGISYPVEVNYYNFSRMARMQLIWAEPNPNLEKEALQKAAESDAVIMFMGLSPRLEGEEMRVDLRGFNGGDRTTLALPEIQVNLLKKIKAIGKPVILVLLNGSALAINWEKDNISAILEAWYPGQASGSAIADILFGDYNPAGRLPITFYKSVQDLPTFEDYSMNGRTYKYFSKEPLFEFGFGLSYSEFEYTDLNIPEQLSLDEKSLSVSVTVKNKGNYDGDEVIQVYSSNISGNKNLPIRSLIGFQRIHLKSGETKTVSFDIPVDHLYLVSDSEELKLIPGKYIISAGGRQPGHEPRNNVLTKELKIN